METLTVPTTAQTRIAADVYVRISQFLGFEALLLDTQQLEDWLALLDDDIVYEIPMRLATRKGASDEYPRNSFRARDDLAMLRKRVERSYTNENWAEDPPSRTVRNVGSIHVEAGDADDTYLVHSAVTVYRQRGLDRAFDWIPARRRDLIRVEEHSCKLVRRTVILAETILQTPNLAIFL
jgi:3-phenylpropionate/cinnamic acid dioxygenase small subunit